MATKNVTQAEYRVPKIKCGGCASAVQEALGGLPGVQDIQVDIAGKRVQVRFEAAQTEDRLLRNALAKAGFPADPA